MSNLDYSKTGSDSDSLEHQSTLFAHLVLQQSNMAMMLLGKVAHPETGAVVKDLEAAKLFIDQLAMLQEKTRGNLSPEESGLLKQTLMALRLAFVEAVESGTDAPKTGGVEGGKTEAAIAGNAPASPAEEDARKKFSKKY